MNLKQLYQKVNTFLDNEGIEKLAKSLAKNKALLVKPNHKGLTLAHLAAHAGNKTLFAALVEAEPNLLQMETQNGDNPAHIAAYNGHLDILQTSIANDPSCITKHNNQGNTPTHLAAHQGHAEMINVCRESDPSAINRRNLDLQSPAHVAAEHNHTDALAACIKRARTTLSTKDVFNMTPVQYADQHNNLEMLYACLVVDTFALHQAKKVKQRGRIISQVFKQQKPEERRAAKSPEAQRAMAEAERHAQMFSPKTRIPQNQEPITAQFFASSDGYANAFDPVIAGQLQRAFNAFKNHYPNCPEGLDQLVIEQLRQAIPKNNSENELSEHLKTVLTIHRYLDEPGSKNNQKAFDQAIEHAAGKGSSTWHALGTTLAIVGLVVAGCALAALLTPASLLIGITALAVIQSAIMLHTAATAAVATSSIVAGAGTAFFMGRDSGLYDGLQNLKKTQLQADADAEAQKMTATMAG